MQTEHTQKRAYTEQETSAYIGMSRSFLRQSRMEGHRQNRTEAPPFIKIGRAVRYLKEDLDQWLDNQRKYTQLVCDGGVHA
ncbi:helix-turn-helix domain-containing protein [Enterovibrio norvegicus]|uniref:Helix-turn-helix domain-containing protein n=1 Tax=Enterovibrio norvegicus DSM 15893 TaxID=1121869 RepID=A0A1I5T505_9GAMM|nr:helix-turn-helix domain-containing protein [Enterovibrio norvegicus]TKF13715.1 helix-turn-helix domain-containing protein [Enterovibrio norvegicus]SFP78134.1 Helix-turn-helix domain-containing protein [Enterovibrio norvegicus DSM 15893]